MPPHPTAGSPDPLWWWIGAHGGAGVSTLTALLPYSADARRAWPSGTRGECPNVVVVARTHAAGLAGAQELASQHAAGAVSPALRLLGLVTVQDAPGRLPPMLRRSRDLVASSYPYAWHLPWVEYWRTTPVAALPAVDVEAGSTSGGSRRGAKEPPELLACGRGLVALSREARVPRARHD